MLHINYYLIGGVKLQIIDCLLIGHNEMKFEEYEKKIRLLGMSSEGYRDLFLNFIRYDNKLFTFPDLFNMLCRDSKYCNDGGFNLGNIFSPTISYLGTYLRKHGISFDYINSFQYNKSKLKDMLLGKKILSIGITTTFYTSLLPIIEIVKYIKEINRTAKIIVGGPFVSTQVRSQLKNSLFYILKKIGADYYINSSQGESTLVDLIMFIKGEMSSEVLKNIYYLENGEYLYTGEKKETNLLEENMVNWRLFSKDIKNIIGVRTTISCPFSCSFCGMPERTGEYQTVSVKRLEEEFNEISELENVTCVNIIDDTFNVPLKRFKEILKMKIEREYSFKWNSYIRCQYLDDEAVYLMKESGCEGAFLGIESGNQKILNNMNKKVDANDYIRGIELLKKHNILTFASFIYGFPGETESSIKDTIQFIKAYKPDFYRVHLWYCEPITPIWKQKDVYNINGSQFSWSHSTMDSKEACLHLEKTFLEVDESIWLPQYNFDFVGIFNLLHRGLSLDQVKDLIRLFNLGIRQKLTKQDYSNMNKELINSMKCILGGG